MNDKTFNIIFDRLTAVKTPFKSYMIDADKLSSYVQPVLTEETEEELVDNDPSEILMEKQATDIETEIAALRAREQEELRNAIPNIADYPDTYADVQGNMPDNLYAIYKTIYDRYDLLITSASGQPTVGIDKFAKKNLFTVTPIQAADKKAKTKASIATQYIGFGEGITGSSTETYRQQAGDLANTGEYSADDVIFVSVPGKRGDAAIAKREQDKTIKEAIKAVEAGATILTDNKAYTDASNYNTGEKRLYANMEAKGYNYSEITVDGQVIGTWSKPTQETSGNIRNFGPGLADNSNLNNQLGLNEENQDEDNNCPVPF
jgi:hypothetical protein